MFCLTYIESYPQNCSNNVGYHSDEKLCNIDSQDQYQQRVSKQSFISNWVTILLLIPCNLKEQSSIPSIIAEQNDCRENF